MEITKYGSDSSIKQLNAIKDIKDLEIASYIPDEKILRVLLESNIHSLRGIQKEAIEQGLFFRKSFLVCAPSGSGKTLIGELCSIHNVFQGFGKSIYLVPFKALASEKHFHFKRTYGKKYGIKSVLSIGDFDVDDSKLENADIIVTTYEKLDSILRNFHDKDWIHQIATIIIDEIHIIGESNRGPRLESLIVRLNESLKNLQIIGLSATINNPKFFTDWLNSLGEGIELIESHERPVPLKHEIRITQNKDSTSKNIVKKTIEEDGQVMIFLNRRKGTQQMAHNLKSVVSKLLSDKEKEICKSLATELSEQRGGNRELQKAIGKGVAFHHAGLLPKERRIVEENYKKRLLKVICCTTTLSAGINLPARTVILKDFKMYSTSGYNIKNFKGFYESPDGFSFFKPFSSNEVFQMLGRAGRPGLDTIGNGIILVKDMEERHWVEDHYFNSYGSEGKKDVPKYNDIISGLNKVNTLKEQVLLRIFEEKHITLSKLTQFFERTYFWHCIKERMQQNHIPIEQLLMIKEISPLNILKLHANPQRVKKLLKSRSKISIQNFNAFKISGMIKTDFGVHTVEFSVDNGIQCTCGFDNGLTDNFMSDEFCFEFCDHVTSFLIHLIRMPDAKFQAYVNDIVPKSVKNQYILSYLLEQGLVRKEGETKLRCTHFGKLIIRLYLYPTSGVLIRNKLEHSELLSAQDLIKESFDILKSEYKVRDYKLLDPILDWCDEVSLDAILDRYRIMAGDLYTVRDNLERIINFMGIIASHLKDEGIEKDKLIRVAETAETLIIRIHHGVREELFDLVIRLPHVGRVRARILHDAGYHTATQVRKETAYVLNKKTGIGVNWCKKILDSKPKKE